MYKTFEWDSGVEDKPKTIHDKFEAYVRPWNIKRAVRFKMKQRK